jgi:hypothetical protein
MPVRLYTQHAKAGLSIVERDALNDAGKHFVVGLICGRRDGHGWIISRPRRIWRVMAWRTSGRDKPVDWSHLLCSRSCPRLRSFGAKT